MSVNSMTNAAIARREDFPPLNKVPRDNREIADAAAEQPAPQSPMTAALAVIVTYVPTEVLTLYVAVLAAITHPEGRDSSGVWVAFWVFLVATPLIVWLVYAAKVRSVKRRLPSRPSEWPVWEMVAGTLAYVAWAVSLPNAPFLGRLGLPATLAAVIVLVTAAALGLLAPLFQRAIEAPNS
jgi:hypothetical protein